MKSVLSIIAICTVMVPSFAAMGATGRGRASMSNQMMTAPRAVASKNQISGIKNQGEIVANPTVKADEKLAVNPEEMKPAEKDMREREKRACLQNNIGIGNTFVWASRYSNLDNYSTMIEDVEEPENNTCFVKVELKSDDPKISVNDVPYKYFEMGRNITCGEWADYEKLKTRVLDAKKGARTWATVGGAVGGAAVGVGAMELFGNKIIDGAVQGQQDKSLSDLDLLRSQLAVLKKENVSDYNDFIKHMGDLKCACSELEVKPDACNNYEYAFELDEIKKKTCN